MAETLHVLFLPRWYPHRYDPMPGLFIRRQAEALSEHCTVAVLYVHEDNQAANRYETEIVTEDRVHVVRVYYKSAQGPIRILNRGINAFRFMESERKGFRVLRNFHPDLLHVHVLTRLGVIAWIYGIVNGKPYVVTEHWSRYFPANGTFRGILRKMLTRRVVRSAARVIPVSISLEHAMQAYNLGGRYQVIPNPVNTSEFRILEGGTQKNDPVKRMIHVSCFDDRSKNISGLLHMLKNLVQKRQDLFCTLVGEGPDLEAMKILAADLGLAGPYVKFTGLLEKERLVKEINDADFMVLSSHFETFGTVIIESLSCGVPVVSTAVGIAPEVIGEANGRVCPPGDPQALEEAVYGMLDACRQYDRRAIRTRVPGSFSMESVGRELFSVYQSVLKDEY